VVLAAITSPTLSGYADVLNGGAHPLNPPLLGKERGKIGFRRASPF